MKRNNNDKKIYDHLIFDHISAKTKHNSSIFCLFFCFLKVLIKGYFRAKFQLPTVSLSNVSLGEERWGVIFTAPRIHRTSIKKPIQNRVKSGHRYAYTCPNMGLKWTSQQLKKRSHFARNVLFEA